MTRSRPSWTTPLEIAVALAIWLTGFVILRATGSFLPLTVGAVSLAALFLARDRALRASLRLSLPTAGLALLLTAGMIGATYGGFALVGQVWAALDPQTVALYGLLRPDRYAPALMAVLLASTAASEEVIFRGKLLSKLGAGPKGVILSAGLYALAHLTGGSALLMALAFACGLFWGAIRRLTGSLMAAIVVHVLWDLCIMLLHPLVKWS